MEIKEVMIVRNLSRYLFLTTIIICSPIKAALDLVLTQGVNGGVPIAIAPFAGQGTEFGATDNVAGVINNDMQHSGRFQVLSVAQLPATPHQASEVNFSTWQQQKINDLVVGQVKSLGNNRYQVQFQLLDVYGADKTASSGNKNSSAPAWSNAVLASQTFTVNGQQLRKLAHHISDIVYEKLTGKRGVFSTRIAYVLEQRFSNRPSTYKLMLADADGYNPRTLLTSNMPIMSPAWAPNGRKIAYVSFEKDHASIYVQDVNTGARQQVSNSPGINNAPAWSPTGDKLAVVLSKTGYLNIYVLNLASGSSHQITNDQSINTEPSFAPDGKSLVFTSNRGGGPQIYQVAIASNGDATGSPTRVTYDGSYNASADFVPPEGKAIVVLHQDGGFNIARQDLQNGRLNVLTQSGDCQSPSVAPNGDMILYAMGNNNNQMLGMVSADGRVKLRLPSHEGNVREPAWSPFLN